MFYWCSSGIRWQTISKVRLLVKVYNIHCYPLIHRSGELVGQLWFSKSKLIIPNISFFICLEMASRDICSINLRGAEVYRHLVVSQIFLLTLQDGCDVCSSYQNPLVWLDGPFQGSSLTTSSASCLSTTGGTYSGLRIVYVQMAPIALSACSTDFSGKLVELTGLGTDFTSKKDKGIFSAFSMYFITRFPAPIVQQPHNLFSCPFAADVFTEAFFTPPSHPFLDWSPADPWLFCLNCCTPKQWFCVFWVAQAHLSFPFIFCIWAQSWVHLCWSSDLVTQPSAQWNKPS